MSKSEWPPQAEELMSRFKQWQDICNKYPRCLNCPIWSVCRGMYPAPWTDKDMRKLTRRFLHLERK